MYMYQSVQELFGHVTMGVTFLEGKNSWCFGDSNPGSLGWE